MAAVKKDSPVKEAKTYKVLVSFLDIEQDRKYLTGEEYIPDGAKKERIDHLIKLGLIEAR